jgi:hypothetical protein
MIGKLGLSHEQKTVVMFRMSVPPRVDEKKHQTA